MTERKKRGISYWSIRRRVRRTLEQNYSVNELKVPSSELDAETEEINRSIVHETLNMHDLPNNDPCAQSTEYSEYNGRKY
jgi:hypothetical protein